MTSARAGGEHELAVVEAVDLDRDAPQMPAAVVRDRYPAVGSERCGHVRRVDAAGLDARRAGLADLGSAALEHRDGIATDAGLAPTVREVIQQAIEPELLRAHLPVGGARRTKPRGVRRERRVALGIDLAKHVRDQQRLEVVGIVAKGLEQRRAGRAELGPGLDVESEHRLLTKSVHARGSCNARTRASPRSAETQLLRSRPAASIWCPQIAGRRFA